MLQSINNIFTGKSLLFLGVVSSILVLVIGVLDYLTGYEINFFVFYAGPIWLASWYGNRILGRVLAIISVFVWYFVDLNSGNHYTNIIAPYWNGLMRLFVFMFLVYALSNIKAKLRLEELNADYDSLTNLLNGRGFREKLDTLFPLIKREQQPYCIAFIDLDNFKHVNDNMGHAEGDTVLKTVAKTMKETLRSSDLICRLGGDEFVIFLPGTALTQAETVIGNLKDKLDNSVQANDWPVGFSVGTCIFDSIKTDPHTAIAVADKLMYEVKKQGKGKVLFSDLR